MRVRRELGGCRSLDDLNGRRRALDFPQPGAVSKLLLVDTGGESASAPPPDSFLAPFPVILRAQAFLQPKFGDAAALSSLHRASPGWVDAYVAYLASGGYSSASAPI